MLTDDDIMQEIISARSGSDIHGLVNKIANYLYSKNPTNSAENDWFMAQTILLRWSHSAYREELQLRKEPDFGIKVTSLLNHYAFRAYNYDRPSHKKSSFDYWMLAQNQLAEQVIWQAGQA